MSGDRPALLHWRDPVAAVLLLTRLPLPADHAAIAPRLAPAAWAWPLVGAGVGAAAGGAALLALSLGLPAGAAAALALLVQAVVTGGLHEDGLCDCADGFWGGASRARRLEIMKDSRIGAHAALALVLFMLLRWSGLAALSGAGLVLALMAAGAASRAGMALVMAGLPPAREGGLSAGIGRPGARTALLALVMAAGLGFACLGPAGLAVAGAALTGALLTGALARARIGGQTGDVLGAAQVVAETGALLAAVIFLQS